MISQRDSWWWFKLNGFLRHSLVNGFGPFYINPLVVTEYPKSGGTWLSQMLSSSLGLDYPRNQLPPLTRSTILHGCYFNSKNKHRTIVLWRDGRDVMVSFYYHLMYEKPITSSSYSRKLKRTLSIKDPADIRGNLPRFIEWCYLGGYPGFSWSAFVEQWHKHTPGLQTSYEQLLTDPYSELVKLIASLDGCQSGEEKLRRAIEEYKFENQVNRVPGQEDVTSFVRKGIVGDWKNHFTVESRQVFAHYGAHTLIELGYESDLGWVNNSTIS